LRDFRKLAVWNKAHALAIGVYRATASFPKDEQYGVTSQLRRSASSVAANMAEGCGREGVAELARFLNISMGSASELEYHIELGRDLGFLDERSYTRLSASVTEVKRMLAAFIQKLKPDS